MTKKCRLKQVKKYSLDEDVQLLLDGQLRIMTLEAWINLYPDVLYNHIYLPGKLQLVKVTIVKSAYIEFKKSLAKMFPDLFKKMIIKQSNAKATPPVHFH